jgi:prepilin-type N-terminal cleavage/methylation domain-containing protein/prepilin-type processing-associated H-X9-DG protein
MKKDRTAGFTLIELLVVIAIIAILAAILFPVFAKARQRAQATTCASNLKQFGTAFMMYGDDYEGRLPSPGGNGKWLDVWDHNNGATLNSYISRGARDQKSAAGIWACPAYEAKGLASKQASVSGGFAARSYGMNSYLRAKPDVEYPACNADDMDGGIAISQIRTSAGTVLLYEGIYNRTTAYVGRAGSINQVMGYYDKPTNDDERAWSAGWHNGMNEYLWCDGHVSSMRPETKTEFSSGYPGWDDKNRWYARKNRH